MSAKTLHFELVVGRRVVDRDGERVGRLEEARVERRNGEFVIVEYFVGRYGFMQRFSIRGFGYRLMSLLGARGVHPHAHCIPWDKLDLSDPEHPRLTCRVDEL